MPKAVERHRQRLGRTPRLVAADAGFSSLANERELERLGVERVAIPNYATRDPETGTEGRISVLKRRHGLDRSRYPRLEGMRPLGGVGGDRRQPDQHGPQPGGQGVGREAAAGWLGRPTASNRSRAAAAQPEAAGGLPGGLPLKRHFCAGR